MEYQSWGKTFEFKQYKALLETNPFKLPIVEKNKFLLPHGLGRSYGDSCLNKDNYLVPMRLHNNFINFDRDKGILKCQAGCSLPEVLDLIVKDNWFLPVTPGTKYVTIGGAIANDIHGKNHHESGSFGNHLLSFDLLRSDNSITHCTKTENTDLFRATIGGLGLTGIILNAEIELSPISGPYINQEIIKYDSLSEFFHLTEESNSKFHHTVAWLDCFAKNEKLGRGLFIRGNHSSEVIDRDKIKVYKPITSIPVEFPGFVLNPITMKIFNFLYYNKQISKYKKSKVYYDNFFYPLDSVNNWNKIYGKRGMFQYQCVISYKDKQDAVKEILKQISNSKAGSFLGVIKTFGNKPSLGLLSFPKPGVTIALDFPNKGEKTLKLFNNLDAIVKEANGRLYPAKDSRMSNEMFKFSFPNYEEFLKYTDSAFSSSFIRRVLGGDNI